MRPPLAFNARAGSADTVSVGNLRTGGVMGIFSKSQPSDAEILRLEQLTQIVTHGLNQFEKVGRALEEIRTAELYRMKAGTFALYCENEWGMSPRHAERLISASAVGRELRPTGRVPENENQARQLSSLEPAHRFDAWEETVAATPEGEPIAGKVLSAAVAKRKKSTKRKPRAVRIRVPGATLVIEPNSRFHGPEESLRFALESLAQKSAA